MAVAILNHTQAMDLYKRGLAVLDGLYGLTTRTAFYLWDPTEQRYDRTHDGLRVKHCQGARWTGARFVRCGCAYCQRIDEGDRVEVVA